MDLSKLYASEIPDFVRDACKTDALRRLRDVGMNCGCEYTDFPRFRDLAPYSRFDHSLGVALIVWQHTHDKRQAMAGLLHDVATPVFAHVIDFLKGDYLAQEATEAGTEATIRASRELCAVLDKCGLTVDEVKDYHLYPVADNDSPRLSADRLEYSLGNMCNYGFADHGSVEALYRDIAVGTNEFGETELVFTHLEQASAFAGLALKCGKVYVCDEDRYAMQRLAEVLADALRMGVITSDDLGTTEPQVIAKLTANEAASQLWRAFRTLCATETADAAQPDGAWRKIDAKKRYIDPYVAGRGRVSALDADFAAALDAFRAQSQDYWVRGY